MTEDAFFDLIDTVLRNLGARLEDGEEYRTPALDVLRYYIRPVKLHWVPFSGRGLSVVAIVRQPVDISLSTRDYQAFLVRLAMAVNGRFPPWGSPKHPAGLALGLTAIVLTPEPIGPGDDAILREIVTGKPLPQQRAVPLATFRVNLGQEAISFALASGPEGIFTEPLALADELTLKLRRYVPLIDV